MPSTPTKVATTPTPFPCGKITHACTDEEFWGSDAKQFRPERWLGEPLAGSTYNVGAVHIAYGSGPRLCPAMSISNHILYVLLTRLILDMQMVADPEHLPSTSLFGDGRTSVNKIPYAFQCYFQPRQGRAERLQQERQKQNES